MLQNLVSIGKNKKSRDCVYGIREYNVLSKKGLFQSTIISEGNDK